MDKGEEESRFLTASQLMKRARNARWCKFFSRLRRPVLIESMWKGCGKLALGRTWMQNVLMFRKRSEVLLG